MKQKKNRKNQSKRRSLSYLMALLPKCLIREVCCLVVSLYFIVAKWICADVRCRIFVSLIFNSLFFWFVILREFRRVAPYILFLRQEKKNFFIFVQRHAWSYIVRWPNFLSLMKLCCLLSFMNVRIYGNFFFVKNENPKKILKINWTEYWKMCHGYMWELNSIYCDKKKDKIVD